MCKLYFEDETHKNTFYDFLNKTTCPESNEYQALLYILSSSHFRNHANYCFDFEHELLMPNVLDKSWQTSGTIGLTKLAFNLFSGRTGWASEEYRNDITPASILRHLDDNSIRIAIEAIRIYCRCF